MAKKKDNRKGKGRPFRYVRSGFGAPRNNANSPSGHSHGYTLADEARNTNGNRRGYRVIDSRLRYKPVTFISAGLMDPLKELEVSLQEPPPARAFTTATNPDIAHDSVPEAAVSAALFTQSPGADDAANRDLAQRSSEHQDDESDPDSDSSVEIIVFKGRNADQPQKTRALPDLAGSGSDDDSAKPLVVNMPLRPVKKSAEVTAYSGSSSQVETLDYISLDASQRKPSSSRKSRLNTNSDDLDEESAIIADYIANMQDDSDDGDDEDNEQDIGHPGLGSHSFSILRDLGGTDSDAIPSPSSSGSESEDELYDELDEQAEEDAEGGESQLESDVHLAQTTAKQEEPGLSDENVLQHDATQPDDGWIAASSAPRRKKKKGASKRSGMFNEGSQFPSASKMAAAFDEMDLMDMQTSRLKKSKKGPISFGLSDSEVERALNAAVKKDRLKKAGKKKAREELRSQGLLGQAANPDDLRIKYSTGMTLHDIAGEIQAFLLEEKVQLTLPPLTRESRRIIHMIANMFGIRSKSSGSGTNRCPVLYRDKGTRLFDQAILNKTLRRVKGTWFPRIDVEQKVSRDTKEARMIASDKPRNPRSFELRNGEAVGQHATEIGADNRGRAMLEKMGWTKGMSLGNEDSKGIIVPLTHIMRKRKAGLGGDL
ncbi:hypothetical protein F4861DRAFT_57456 [Xylaria intraflava]|nr:hypothetical protein F4861DRAFT_57456 [Xylaria intraflava]